MKEYTPTITEYFSFFGLSSSLTYFMFYLLSRREAKRISRFIVRVLAGHGSPEDPDPFISFKGDESYIVCSRNPLPRLSHASACKSVCFAFWIWMLSLINPELRMFLWAFQQSTDLSRCLWTDHPRDFSASTSHLVVSSKWQLKVWSSHLFQQCSTLFPLLSLNSLVEVLKIEKLTQRRDTQHTKKLIVRKMKFLNIIFVRKFPT